MNTQQVQAMRLPRLLSGMSDDGQMSLSEHLAIHGELPAMSNIRSADSTPPARALSGTERQPQMRVCVSTRMVKMLIEVNDAHAARG
jgi:hypothetical protein